MVVRLEDMDAQIERAFHLAYFIHGDKETALRIVVGAVSKLEVAACAQHKRLYYRPSGRQSRHRTKPDGFRSKVSFSGLHLLQRLVYVESEYFEKLGERGGPAAVGEEEMLIRFVKHLVRITIKRNSFYVTLGLSRLLYNYTTPETMEIYNAVIQEPERVKDDYYYRSRKAVLIRELRERFGDAIRVSRGARGEERFQPDEDQEEHVSLIQRCLFFFTPWGTSCLVPAGCDPILDGIPLLAGGGQGGEDEVEVNRIHTILDPECYGRLTQALGFDRPERRLRVPHFFLSGDGVDKNDRRNPPPFTDEDARAVKARLAEQAERRGKASIKLLRVLVDGTERARVDLKQTRRASFAIEAGAELIEVRAADREGEILLASHLLTYDDAGRGGRPARFSTRLANGSKISFTVALSRSASGEAAGGRVEIGYVAGGAFSTVPLFFRRLASKLSKRGRTLGRLGGPPLVPVMALALIALCAVGFVVYVWKDEPAGESPRAAANQPVGDAANKEDAGAAVTAPGVGAPTPSVEVNRPERPGREANVSNGGSRRAKPRPPGGEAPQLVEGDVPRPGGAVVNSSDPETGGTKPDKVDAEHDLLRSPRSEFAIKSLREVRKVCVQAPGDAPASRALAEALGERLGVSGRLSFTRNTDEADACLKVTARPVGGGRGGSEQLSVSVRLVDARGQSLWPASRRSGGRTYSGAPAHVAEQVVKDLLAEIRRLGRGR